MTGRGNLTYAVIVLSLTLIVTYGIGALAAPPASAGLCGAVGAISGWAGKACSVVTHPDKAVKAGKSLATGHVGQAVKAITSSGGGKTAIGLAALVTWVVVGAKSALNATAGVIKRTTTPQLRSTWFSALYWRMTAIGALLTLPFLFAATGQAIVRSDLALLSRAALGYLPLALLAVGIAAPVTMLLLTATDQMSAVVSAAAGQAGSRFLTFTGQHVASVDPLGQSAFLKFLIALLASAAAVVLWIEMLMRDAAVYIVVLMLPLVFAAMVWPARRVWAMRIAEVLVAVIVAKFLIVAILALGGAAIGPAGGTTGLMVGLVLVSLAAFSPWALLRVIPLAELASGAVGHLRSDAARGLEGPVAVIERTAGRPLGWAGDTVATMQRSAEENPDRAPAVTRRPYESDHVAAPSGSAGECEEHAGAGPATAGPLGAAGSEAPRGGSDPGNGAGADTAAAVLATSAEGADADSTKVPAMDAPSQRLPGLPEIYQRDDLGMPTVVLGLEGLPNEPLHPRQADLRARPVDDSDRRPADDADPRPEGQAWDEGVL